MSWKQLRRGNAANGSRMDVNRMAKTDFREMRSYHAASLTNPNQIHSETHHHPHNTVYYIGVY
jgi:hypothetical protein